MSNASLKLFVVDTGPLITLAAAQSLDYLLFVNVADTRAAIRDLVRRSEPNSER